jgi:hypothetical protein
MATQGQTMSLPQQATNAVGIPLGGVAATNPLWLDPSWLVGPYQAIMAIGGLVVLCLTLWNLIEGRMQKFRQRQRDMDKGQ